MGLLAIFYGFFYLMGEYCIYDIFTKITHKL